MGKSGRVVVLSEWMEVVLKAPKELKRCVTPPRVFLQRFKQPHSFPALVPVPPAALCWHSSFFGCGWPRGGKKQLEGWESCLRRLQHWTSVEGAQEARPSGFQDASEPPLYFFSKHLVGNSCRILDAVVWSLLVNVGLFVATAMYWFSLET